jgi:serine/threonine protein kinase
MMNQDKANTAATQSTLDAQSTFGLSQTIDPTGMDATLGAANLGANLGTTVDVGSVSVGGRPSAFSMPGVLVRASAVQDGAVGKATISGFSTMLPKLEGRQLVHEPQPRFELLKALGQGGMGEVNLVKDHEIGRTVAVKRLLGEGHDAGSIARFVDEVRTTGHLEHPNIVPIYDAGVDEQGRCFFIMKRLDGETLEEIIAKLKAGSPEYLEKYSMKYRLQIFVGLLNALSYAHAQGIVHRDIKPANVMVGKYGEVVLMDWGVAKPIHKGRRQSAAQMAAFKFSEAAEDKEVLEDAEQRHARLFETRHGALVGTPAYMSPEQAQGLVDEVDERSDIYSACVLMSEFLMLGHYLQDKRSINEMLMGILGEDPKPILQKFLAENIQLQGWPPVEVIPLILKGLEKKPEDRHQSVQALLADLRDAESGKGCVVCSFTLTKRGVNEAWRLVEKYPFLVMPTMVMMMVIPKKLINKYPAMTAPITMISFMLPILLLGYLLNYGVTWLVT